MSDLAIFREKFLPNLDAARLVRYRDWRRANPKEAERWDVFRDAILAGETPTPPPMGTAFGLMLVSVGELAMSVTDIGSVPPPAPPPGFVLNSKDNFDGLFIRHTGYFPPQYITPGFTQVATPYGTGLDFVISDSLDVASWDASMKAVLTKQIGCVGVGNAFGPVEGKTDVWNGYFQLPSAGNPNGFPGSWAIGTLWEFHGNGATSGHTFALDPHWYPGEIHFRASYALDSIGNYEYYNFPDPIQYDHWYFYEWTIHWARDSSGFVGLTIDGVRPRALDLNGAPPYSRSGPSMFSTPGDTPSLQAGFYSSLAGAVTNQIQFGPINLSRT